MRLWVCARVCYVFEVGAVKKCINKIDLQLAVSALGGPADLLFHIFGQWVSAQRAVVGFCCHFLPKALMKAGCDL